MKIHVAPSSVQISYLPVMKYCYEKASLLHAGSGSVKLNADPGGKINADPKNFNPIYLLVGTGTYKIFMAPPRILLQKTVGT